MHTVIGAFDDRSTAQRAVDRLMDAGFDRKDVHLEYQGSGQTTTTTQDRGGWSFFGSLFGTQERSDTTYASHGQAYDEAVRRGSSVVVVDAHSESEADRAATLLNDLGAYDIDERARQWGLGGSTATGTTGELKAGQAGVANVVQEELQVGKRAVDRGGVRVVQRVSQKPVHEVVRLREEHAKVERQKVDRPATSAELSNFKDGTIEVRETVEEPVVAKQARVVEEVRVGKDVREREHTVDDTVRRKDVDVERVQGSNREVRESAVAADKKAAPGTTTSKDKPRI